MQPEPSQRLGKFHTTELGGEAVRAYVPAPLPPIPPLDMAPLLGRYERANRALGRLDGIASILPSPQLFLYMYVRKEALLSSQIEGTQSSLSDLLLFETEAAPEAPVDDVTEVSNYVAALEYGLERLRREFPLSLRLIREMHAILLSDGRGSEKQPGEFRTSQNWIGGTRPGNAVYVPPPVHELMGCLGNLETFLHDRSAYPVLLRAALAHVQFETIHPFLDGNGRLGRLLITLLLVEEQALKAPILYLSLYLKTHRSRYYELLQEVRLRGAWEAWVEFFLDGVAETSEMGVETARRLKELFDADHAKAAGLGRPAASALRVHRELQHSPILSVQAIAMKAGLSQPTAQSALDHLQRLGIVDEITGRQRGRLYRYSAYLSILDEGTEPLNDMMRTHLPRPTHSR